MNNKYVGLVVAVIAVVLLILIYSIVPIVQNTDPSTCSCQSGETCEYADRLPWQVYLGVGTVLVMFVLSYIIITEDKPKRKKVHLPHNLSKEEKQVLSILVKNDGVIFQSELVDKLGVSKVKVTRLLDKLEGRKLIERRRRGMSNVVILKAK